MRKYVIMGPQGSGKGTQASRLCRDLDIVHISAGEIFRWNIEAHTRLGARVERSVNEGRLVADDIVSDVIRRRLEEHDWNFGFILDGFPRNGAQAEFFLERYDIDALIYLHIPDEVVFERVLSRRLCSRCGQDYNLLFSPPAVPDTCDVCGGRLIARADDTEESLRSRLAAFHRATEPVVELFRGKGPVIKVDGTGTPDATQAQIRTALDLPAG